MIETSVDITTQDFKCTFCKNPNCTNPKNSMYLLDPDTLERAGPNYILGAPRLGRSIKIFHDKHQPLPQVTQLNNRIFLDFKGKFNESAWLRCAKILEELKYTEAHKYAIEFAHKIYMKKQTYEEKIGSIINLYKNMYPNEDIPISIYKLV